MSKPTEFRHIYILTADIPYSNADKSGGGTQNSEGMLLAGRVVYLSAPPAADQVPAYAEGLGIVAVKAEALARAS